MKKFFILIAALVWAAAAFAQDWGGRYVVEILEGEQSSAQGELYLVPVSTDEAEFLLVVKHKDRGEIVLDSSDGPVRLTDGCFTWKAPDSDYTLTIDLSPEDADGMPLDGKVMVSEHLESGMPPYNVDFSPGGYYSRDYNYFVTPDDYMYRISEDGGSCSLALGGIYAGEVVVPAKVTGLFGVILPVSGVDADAFKFSRRVTSVNLHDGQQKIGPGALGYTEVPYDFNALPKPFFAYPSKDRARFVIPGSDPAQGPENNSQWVIFKQNLAPALQSGCTAGKEGKLEGRVDQDFNLAMGFIYTLQSSKEEIARMFKGYRYDEIEALVADPRFVAFHTFPAFGRWKFPETEVSAPKGIENAVARKFGREVMYSRKVAWLRDGSGELDLVEFKHKDFQAMVVFVWSSRGEILATATQTTEIESEFEESGVWNVDDEGTYGIPDVVTIAQDPDGNAIIFLAKNAPESINCFALRQVGDKLERIDFDQWYRYVDIL